MSETISKFRQHDALTLKVPRTLEQAEGDPMAWWTPADAAAAQEARLRAQLGGHDQRSLLTVAGLVVIGLTAFALIVAIAAHSP